MKVLRIFRHLESIGLIFTIVSGSLSTFVYLTLLLLIFIVIFALVGMRLFGGILNHEAYSDITPRANFNSFHWAFITVFQILTFEDWQEVLYDAMRSNAGKASAIYFIIWVFLGNMILLNLIFAMVLDVSLHEKQEASDSASLSKSVPKLLGSSLSKRRISKLVGFENINARRNKMRDIIY